MCWANQCVFSGGARRLADALGQPAPRRPWATAPPALDGPVSCAARLLRDGPWAAEAVAAARAGAALARPLAARPASCGCGADPEAAAAVPGWRHVIVPRRAAGLCAAAAAAAAEGDGASAEPGQVSSRLLPARCRLAWGPAACPGFTASAAPPPSAGRGPPGLARPLSRRPLYSRRRPEDPTAAERMLLLPGRARPAEQEAVATAGGRARSEGSAGAALGGPDPPGCHGHRAPTPTGPSPPPRPGGPAALLPVALGPPGGFGAAGVGVCTPGQCSRRPGPARRPPRDCHLRPQGGPRSSGLASPPPPRPHPRQTFPPGAGHSASPQNARVAHAGAGTRRRGGRPGMLGGGAP